MMRRLPAAVAAVAMIAAPALAQDTDQEATSEVTAQSDDCEVFGVAGLSIMQSWQNGATAEQLVDHWSQFDGELGATVLLIVETATKVERFENRDDRAQAVSAFREIVVAACREGRRKADENRESEG